MCPSIIATDRDLRKSVVAPAGADTQIRTDVDTQMIWADIQIWIEGIAKQTVAASLIEQRVASCGSRTS